MDSGLSVVLLGLLLGVQHATDADHVVAVATIVSRTRRLGAGVLIGALWGVGHTVAIALAGGAIVAFGLSIGPAMGRSLELAVAVMLMALGSARIVGVLRESDGVAVAHLMEPHPHAGAAAFHSHSHAHGGTVHRHAHVHPSRLLGHALQEVGPAQALRSVATGVVHGLAGSAAVALLVLSTLRGVWAGVAYLLVFGAGTLVGMTAITAILTLPFGLSAPRLSRWRRSLAMGTGICSLAVGLHLAVRIGVRGVGLH